MLRYNTGKAPLALVPSSFYRALADSDLWGNNLGAFDTYLIEDVGHVIGFGAQKYSANNWRKSGSWLGLGLILFLLRFAAASIASSLALCSSDRFGAAFRGRFLFTI